MAAEAILRQVQPGDVPRLARTMRAADAAECLALSGMDPAAALWDSLGRSHTTFAAEAEGELLAIGGVSEGPRETFLAEPAFQTLWLLTGEPVDRHQVAFWRASKRVVEGLRREWPVLVNLVDARYAAALRWVRRLGAEVRPPVLEGVEGRLFHPVVWRS